MNISAWHLENSKHADLMQLLLTAICVQTQEKRIFFPTLVRLQNARAKIDKIYANHSYNLDII